MMTLPYGNLLVPRARNSTGLSFVSTRPNLRKLFSCYGEFRVPHSPDRRRHRNRRPEPGQPPGRGRLDRPPPAHDHRPRHRQRDEHGLHTGRLCQHLPRNRPTVPLPWLWPQLAAWFGIPAAPYPGHATSLENVLSADASPPFWADIAARHGLRENALDRRAFPWHTDADLGRPIECVTDMSKSHTLGFTAYQTTPESFFNLFEILRAQCYIP